MTIEIALLPVSCRTFHKITHFVWKVILNLVAWGGLIVGIGGILFPADITINFLKEKGAADIIEGYDDVTVQTAIDEFKKVNGK